MKITLITTGGTIDGADSEKGTSRPESDAARWFRKQKNLTLDVRPLFNKDSREITHEDRGLIAQAVQAAPSQVVIITHGTFTIAETGRYLKAVLPERTKRVLLLGAWLPLHEENSDAPGQLEFVLTQISDVTPGVYIAMDKRLWDPNTTEKVQKSDGNYCLKTVGA